MASRKQLSTHFNVAEFDCRNGVRVPPVAREALALLCNALLEKMRAEFGVCHVLSGYRTPSYNRYVGGASDSRHLYDKVSPLTPEACITRGVAADVTFRHGKPEQWAQHARAIIADSGYLQRRAKGGVGTYVAQGFVHLDTGPRRDWRG